MAAMLMARAGTGDLRIFVVTGMSIRTGRVRFTISWAFQGGGVQPEAEGRVSETGSFTRGRAGV